MLNKKTIGMLLKQKTLRVTVLLIVIFALASLILLGVNNSLGKKIANNENQIQDIQIQLQELQQMTEEEVEKVDQRVEGRSFAPYDEIVPFISLLEGLFAIIDNESKITIKNEEEQILINRYADYEVNLNPGTKTDLFLKALNELHKSKYLTKVISFDINYAPDEKSSLNAIEDVNLTIRLYFE
jgi:hypothetical protein